MKPFRYLLIGIFLIFLYVAFWPRYYIRTALDPYVNILSTSKEAFIYVGRRTTGLSGSMLRLVFSQMINIYPAIYDGRDDLILIHISSSGGIHRFDMRNFGFSGSIFPKDGFIYYLRGGLDGNMPRMWQWDGKTFVKLDEARTSKILSSFTFTSTLIKAEGWEEMRISFNGNESTSSFSLGAGQCVLSLARRGTGENILQVIKVYGQGIVIPEQLLIEQDGASKAVSRKKYNEEISR